MTDTPTRADLIERLRSVDVSWSEVGEWCAEAAAALTADAERIAALEDENAALKAIQADEGEMLTIAWMDGAHRSKQTYRERIAALEGEVERLREALEEGRRAIGDHSAPDDCYATGPLTGDDYRDLVECPACSFIAVYEALKGTDHDPA